ncbi:MAG TPA: glycosyltransferase [Solirubrobacteraceae bacterium]|jgi:glycosyltransferase involved in cell wall biosynthesis|nr:glycosyltransferase [Solirubrobacteraceae bacterium]
MTHQDIAGTPRADATGAASAPAGGGRSELRDLLVTTQTPALRSGRAMRTYAIARALAGRRPLDLLYVRFGAQEPDRAFREIEGIELHEAIASRGLRRVLAYMRARGEGVPRTLARAVSPELTRITARMARTPGRGRVIADGPDAAAALMGLARRQAVIYNAHNLESAFRHELVDMSERDRRQLTRFETRLLQRFAQSWMVSDADIEGARALCPQAEIRYAPNAVDVSGIAPAAPNLAARQAVFIASFAYLPNRHALDFLVKEVMPRVWSQVPEAKLAVAGSGLTEPPSTDPRVSVLGFVEDLDKLYASSSCAVVPLLQGGGSPLKLVEALAHGLPAIATQRACAGLRLRDGVDCVVANGAAGFAQALARVLRDGAPEIAAEGRRAAERLYSIEALSELIAP